MPKLPHVSGATAIRALERLGFVQIRQSGSHVIMRRGSKNCVVPMHSETRWALLPAFCAKPTYRQTNSSMLCELGAQLAKHPVQCASLIGTLHYALRKLGTAVVQREELIAELNK